MKLFFQIVCGPTCTSNPLTTVEWYLVFTSLAIVLSQLPNLNSIAGISLIGAVTAITYSTMVWVLSVSQQRPPSISYEPLSMQSSSSSLFLALNALGIVAFSFRGHNLVLEVQVTMSCQEIVFLLPQNLFLFFLSNQDMHIVSFRPQCHQLLSTLPACQCGKEPRLLISSLQCASSLFLLVDFGPMGTK